MPSSGKTCKSGTALDQQIALSTKFSSFNEKYKWPLFSFILETSPLILTLSKFSSKIFFVKDVISETENSGMFFIINLYTYIII